MRDLEDYNNVLEGIINCYNNIEVKNPIKLCSGNNRNDFFNAFYLAYALHGEVTISPDDVW